MTQSRQETLQALSNKEEIDCIITSGGTGLTGRDTTPEAVIEIADKTIEGFGELFRQISFSKIGTSAIQSRALAALINTTYVFCLPGSNGACKDGWDEILKYQLDIRHRPCSFVDIMPRLSEKQCPTFQLKKKLILQLLVQMKLVEDHQLAR